VISLKSISSEVLNILYLIGLSGDTSNAVISNLEAYFLIFEEEPFSKKKKKMITVLYPTLIN